MASLPVPAKTYFQDFSFDTEEFLVERNDQRLNSYKGLRNDEDGEEYIHFMIDNDILVGDILISGRKRYIVKDIEFDSFNGKDELIRAIY